VLWRYGIGVTDLYFEAPSLNGSFFQSFEAGGTVQSLMSDFSVIVKLESKGTFNAELVSAGFAKYGGNLGLGEDY
jgi:hypothetical protein